MNFLATVNVNFEMKRSSGVSPEDRQEASSVGHPAQESGFKAELAVHDLWNKGGSNAGATVPNVLS